MISTYLWRTKINERDLDQKFGDRHEKELRAQPQHVDRILRRHLKVPDVLW